MFMARKVKNGNTSVSGKESSISCFNNVLSDAYKKRLWIKFILSLKAPITTAADDKFCDIFPNFQNNEV